MSKLNLFLSGFLIIIYIGDLQAEINQDKRIDFGKLEMNTKLLAGEN